jgi:branched-chain amino acid transport system substrate-binding protein
MKEREEVSEMKKSRWAFGLLLVVLALGLVGLLAACGGGETTTTTAATTATTAAPTETTAAPTETTAAPTETTVPAAERETLEIGVILSLSDWYSAVDALEKTDVELVAQMINEEGGITVQGKTYNVKLLIEDGKSTLDGNTAAANKLVLDDKVQFVIGPAAFFNLATSAIFEQAKVLHVASYNGLQPGEMGPDTPYEFLGLDPIAQQDVALKAVKALYPDVKTVVLATEDATYPAFENGFKELVPKNGLTFAGDPVLFATNAEDYNPIATKIMNLNPDAVWMAIGIPPSECAIAKGLRTLGYTGPIVWAGYAPMTVGLVGPEAANDIINILSARYQAPGNPPILDQILAMGDTERQWFGMAPNGLYMLKYAIEAADSLDPTVVRDTWENLDTIPTVYGDGFPSGDQLYGLHHHAWAYPCAVTLIMNGQIESKPWISPDPTP